MRRGVIRRGKHGRIAAVGVSKVEVIGNDRTAERHRFRVCRAKSLQQRGHITKMGFAIELDNLAQVHPADVTEHIADATGFGIRQQTLQPRLVVRQGDHMNSNRRSGAFCLSASATAGMNSIFLCG